VQKKRPVRVKSLGIARKLKVDRKKAQAGCKGEKARQEMEGAQAEGLYMPHLFSEKRKVYIQSMRLSGASYTEACESWVNSKERAALLAPLDLPELKRRRFVEKSCQHNPFRAVLGGC
jgi:hypothetical protein